MKRIYPEVLILTDTQKQLLLDEYKQNYFVKYNSQKSKNSLIKHILKMQGISLKEFIDLNLTNAFEVAMSKLEESPTNLDRAIKQFMKNLMGDLINTAANKCETDMDNVTLNNLIDTILLPILWTSHRKLSCHMFINSKNNSLKVLYLTDKQAGITKINISLGISKFTIPEFKNSINRKEREVVIENVNDDVLLKLLLIKNRLMRGTTEDMIYEASAAVVPILSIYVVDYYDIEVL